MTTEIAAEAAPPDSNDRARPQNRRLGLALALIAITQLTIVLDSTIVTVALPHIQAALDFTNAGLQWIVTAYTLVFGGLLLLGGRLGDVFGRRTMLMVGMGVFVIASFAGGFANSDGFLIAARVVQGIGAAVMAPATLALIVDNFPEGTSRNRAMSVWAAMSSLGGAVGLIAGGLLTEYASWRWTFFVNVPIGIAVILLAPIALGESTRRRERLDLFGAFTATTGIGALIYGLSSAAPAGPEDSAHWGSAKVLVSIIAGVILLVAFLVAQRRNRNPLLPLHILTNRNRAAGYIVAGAIGISFYGVLFFLTLFMQGAWNYSPVEAGLAYVPWVFVFAIGATISGQILPRVGARALMVVGAVLATGGLFWLAQLSDTSSYASGVLGPIILTPFGFGLMAVPLAVLAMSGVSDSEAGVASSVLNVSQQVGASIGVAGLGTVAWTVVSNNLGANASTSMYNHAMSIGFDRAFLITAGVAFVALLASLMVRLPKGTEEEPAAVVAMH